MKRAVFWVLFLAVAAGAFGYFWKKNDPLRRHPVLLELWVKHNVRLLGHSHPEVAEAAWAELWHLYYTKWAAVPLLPPHAGDQTPISFLIVRRNMPAGGDAYQPAMAAFSAVGKAVYAKAEGVYCRTVGEAVLAIIYREKRWKSDYAGDWKSWWAENRKHYGQ